MTDQEIRAKSLEIAVLMRGKEEEAVISQSDRIGGLINRYLALAAEIEQYIRQGLDKKN